MKTIWNTYKTLIIVVISALVFITVVRQCEKEPKIVIKTETKYIKVTDTITKTIISEPKTVYVKKYVDVKGETQIVYLDKQDTSALPAKEYKTKLKSNNAVADIKILTTGDLLDVSGVITYNEKETTTTITKTRAKSGLFIYGSAPLNINSVEAGLLYQFKNTVGIMVGIEYNDLTNSADIKVGLAVKIF
jgi:hypothetical protein